MENQKRIMEEFQAAFQTEGRTKKWIASNLGILPQTLSRIISGEYNLSERNRKKMNELLGTNIGDPNNVPCESFTDEI